MDGAAKRIVAGILAFTIPLALATGAAAQAPIRIGASLSLTGPYSALGQNQHRGYQLCAKHVNEKGGVLGRKIEFVLYDDQSQPGTAVRLYEKLITQDRVDLVLGPYGSPITEAVANVNEKYGMPMIAPMGAVSSIYQKGRKHVFGVQSPAEVYLEGLIDLAARHGLKTVALVNEDTLFGKTTVRGTIELARQKGLQVVFTEAYPKGTTDFSAILTKIRALNPDVLGAAGYFDDSVAITRQMKELRVNPRMYGVTTGGDLPKFYEMLGRNAEYVYGATQWDPKLRYPESKEFVEAYTKEFPGADLSYHSAGGYVGCRVFVEAIRLAGSLAGDKIRDTILKMDIMTAYGAFKVDHTGFQVAHKMALFQWQDGKKEIVWPEDLATGKARIPTPPWDRR